MGVDLGRMDEVGKDIVIGKVMLIEDAEKLEKVVVSIAQSFSET